MKAAQHPAGRMARRPPHRWAALALAATLAAGVAGPAQAGRGCEARPPTTAVVRQAMDLAVHTAEALDARGDQVVLLARDGQDLSRWGLRWSHLAWAYRTGDGAGARWRVVHKLNTCGTDRSGLYRQGLGEFFLDDLHRYRALVVVLPAELQAALLPLLQDDRRLQTLHTPAYNLVAYPWSQRYQQSNQWGIETLALAMDPQAGDRRRAQAWLRLNGYAPTVLRISALERLGAHVGQANVAFDDHPNGERFAGRIATVTVDSVLTWLRRRGWAETVLEVTP